MDKTFRKAAAKALVEWGREEGLEDLVQAIWVWYLERPGTQDKFAQADEFLVRNLAYRAALQILSGEAVTDDVFTGRSLYSVDSVKDALKGETTNRHLPELVELALEAVQQRDADREDEGKPRDYAEAIRSRYIDGIVPAGPDADRLFRALTAVTEEVNVLYLTSDARGRHAMFPDLRKANGGHSDPTGEIACTLIDYPELRDEFYEQLSVDLLLKGAHAQHIGWDVQRNGRVRNVPGFSYPGAVPAPETVDDLELECSGP